MSGSHSVPGIVRPRMGSGEATIFQTLRNAGYECYLVGGSVRDRLLGRPDADADFTTNARPQEIQRLFRRSFYPNRFGTVLVLLAGAQYEVTTYRGEGRYSDHRHPDEVAFVDTLGEDLQRRDFTINAMAMDAEGRLVDPFGGLNDLERRLIRAVGDPHERLTEDPLRMMRAARLAAQLRFSIDRPTWDAIAANAALLSAISRERVRDELLKLLASEAPVTGIDFLDHLRLLELVLPELGAVQHVNGSPDDDFDLYQHALASLRGSHGGVLLRLACLLHVLVEVPASTDCRESGSVVLERALAGLRLSNADAERVLRLILALGAIPPDLRVDERVVRRLLSTHGDLLPELLAVVAAHRQGRGRGDTNRAQLRQIARLAGKIREERQPLNLSDLAVSGSDLMQEFGLTQGKIVGALLRTLLEHVLDDPALNERATLLQIAGRELQPTHAASAQRNDER